MKFYNYINESINDKGIFKSIIMSGTPGSGKSFTISKIKGGDVPIKIVNTDIWVEHFMKNSDFNWSKYGDKSKHLTKTQLVQYLNSLLPLIIDGTSSNPSNTLKRTGILKSLGYDVGMVWVNTSLETSLKRNKNRDRQVDEDFLKSVFEKAEKLKPYYKTQFSYFVEINNDDGELTDDIIIKCYNKTQNFFNSPLKNPIGNSLIEEMKEQGHKYLIDTGSFTLPEIKKYVNTWYKG